MNIFNVRVYGVYINDNKEVLVSDEWIRHTRITKFCGGGLEWGEGTIDCLKREFMEETKTPVEIIEHLYTTDFFVQSMFTTSHQILSIYYRIKLSGPLGVPIHQIPFDYNAENLKEHEQTGETATLRFIPWEKFSEDSVDLVIDKVVAKKIKALF